MISSSLEEKHQSTQPLLREDDSTRKDSEDVEQPEPSSPYQKPLRNTSWLCLHILLIILYSSAFAALFFYQIQDHHSLSPILPLPARKALQPELRYFPTNLDGNPFAGAPRKELHEAWHKLLQNDNIRLPKSTLEALGLSSVYVRDSSEGIASLSVYHALHCVKKVHEMMYKEHYHSGKTKLQMQREAKHADHCVEYLRESLMCKPDLSLVTFRWINDTSQHPDEPEAFYPTNFDAGLHECANWGSLNAWAEERVFDLYNVELLNRPEPANYIV